jgi:hypothetical protein
VRRQVRPQHLHTKVDVTKMTYEELAAYMEANIE